MPSSKLFPKEIIEYTTESYLHRYSRVTSVTYIIVLLSFTVFMVLLPFTYVQVSVRSSGLLRSATEVSLLKSLVNGKVKEVMAKENSEVQAGQLLFVLELPAQEEKEKYLMTRIKEITFFTKDLSHLLQNQPSPNPVTAFYRQSLYDYNQKLIERQNRFSKAKKTFDRNKKLFDESVIAQAEFENFTFEFDQAKAELELVKQSQFTQWQEEVRTYEKELRELQSQLIQLRKEKENLLIKAPVTGTVQNLSGLYPGSLVFTNQELGQIIPGAGLVAEILVTPDDIGMLRTGMPARLQIDAFDYNQWGLCSGRIEEISTDVHIIQDKPFFKVKCVLDRDYLELKNGYKGKLKKGMSIQARFLVTERSLWQLLYDKIDDWVNPNLLSST